MWDPIVDCKGRLGGSPLPQLSTQYLNISTNLCREPADQYLIFDTLLALCKCCSKASLLQWRSSS